MFRAGLRMLLNSSMPEVVVTEAGNMNEALQAAPRQPDVVLLDIKLPGLSGMEGIALLKREWPQVPVLMLSAQDEPEMVRTASARGAAGFVSKAETAERIIEVIEQVLRNEHPAPAVTVEDELTTLRLTPRQCEVLELLCQGLSNKLIARRLDLSENTVRWHVQAILSALQVSSRSEAAFAARQLGLVG
jgi:DNA-binding NarL/FixJ family response regulator